MSGQTTKQTFEIESGDQQGVEIKGGGGEFVQSHHEQEIEGNCRARAQFRQFEFAAPEGTAGRTEFLGGAISE